MLDDRARPAGRPHRPRRRTCCSARARRSAAAAAGRRSSPRPSRRVAGALYLDLGFDAVRDWLVGAGRARSCRRGADRSRSRAPRAGSRSTPSAIPATGPSTASSTPPARTTRRSFRIEVGVDGELLGVGEGPSRRVAETAAAAEAIEQLRGASAAPRRSATRRASDGSAAGRPRAAPARAPAAGLQVVRRADERRVRAGHQRRRRAERVGQEQPRRRPALGARRAGPGAPLAQVRGRHLGRLGQARRAGHGRRHARPRQRRRPAAGRLPGPRARPAAVPLRRERLPPEQAAGSGCATSSTCSTRRTSPTTPSCSSARAWSTRRWRCGRRSAGRCSRRSPASAATSAAAGGPRSSWSSPRRTSPASRTSSASSGRRRAGWPPRPSSRRPARRPRDELAAALLLAMHARWHEAADPRRGDAGATSGRARADADRAMARPDRRGVGRVGPWPPSSAPERSRSASDARRMTPRGRR